MPYVKSTQKFSRPYAEEQVCPVCHTNLGETDDTICSEACETVAEIKRLLHIEWMDDYI